MARRKRLTESEKQEIVAHWKAGRTQRWLADEYDISVGVINRLCKGIEQSNADIVNSQVAIKQQLATKSEQEVNAVHNLVNERTEYLAFFNNAAVKNIDTMMQKVGNETSIGEHKMASDAIAKAKETVCGKMPEIALQVNNETQDKPITIEVIDARK